MSELAEIKIKGAINKYFANEKGEFYYLDGEQYREIEPLNGRIHILICEDGKKRYKLFCAKRLMAETFIEPHDGHYVHQLNGDKEDFSVDNLVWSRSKQPNPKYTETGLPVGVTLKRLKTVYRYIATISRGGKTYYLGSFRNEETACRIVEAAREAYEEDGEIDTKKLLKSM